MLEIDTPRPIYRWSVAMAFTVLLSSRWTHRGTQLVPYSLYLFDVTPSTFLMDRTSGLRISLDDPWWSLSCLSRYSRTRGVGVYVWARERPLKLSTRYILVRAWSVIHLADTASLRISLTAICAISTRPISIGLIKPHVNKTPSPLRSKGIRRASN